MGAVNALREKREKMGWSQGEAADYLGVTRQYYNYIERSKKVPSVELAKKIGAAFDIDWTIFFKDEVNN